MCSYPKKPWRSAQRNFTQSIIKMLDNISIYVLAVLVQGHNDISILWHWVTVLAKNQSLIEASGGISESSIVAIAKAGVDIISIGKLTHSAQALDMSLKIADGVWHLRRSDNQAMYWHLLQMPARGRAKKSQPNSVDSISRPSRVIPYNWIQEQTHRAVIA